MKTYRHEVHMQAFLVDTLEEVDR